ncbi:sugar phosphate isomerase/epimerase, partial [Erwinia amylovora]|nr:sugar phosphate isomerase/epimerase [Erwinia amylovora]
ALDQADSLWRETLALLPGDVPRALEFPREGSDLVATTRHYVDLLREV